MVAPPASPAPLPPGPSSGPGRFRRVLGTMGAVMGLTAVFVSALVVSVAVHLDLAPTRRVVRTVANGILGTTFKGKLVLGEIDRLSLRGLSVRSVAALDPRGVEVVRIDGLRADTDVIAIAKSALFGGGSIRVPVPLIHIDRVDVGLEPGEAGGPTIADTFLLRNPSPSAPGGPPPRVTLDRIEVDRITAHGAVAPKTPLDAELAHVVGSVRVDREGVAVDVGPVRVDARAPVPQPLAGDARFHLHVPPAKGNEAAPPPRMETGFDGRIGDIEVHVSALMEGAHVKAKVEVPRATPEAIAAFLPDKSTKLPLYKPASVVANAEGDLPELAVDAQVGFEGSGSVDAKGKLSLNAPPTLDLAFNIRALDPRVALEVPQATPLDAEGRVRLGLGDALEIDASVTTKPLAIANNPIPAVKAQASLSKGAWKGNAHVDEEGAPTDATFSFDNNDGLRFEVETQAASIRAVRRISAPVDGSAKVKVAGTLKDGAIDAKVTGRVGGIRAPGDVALDEGNIDARVRGPVTSPTIDASVRGRGVRANRYAFETIEVRAAGPALGMRVETKLDAANGDSIQAAGAIDGKAKAVRDVKVTIARREGTVEATVAQVSSTPAGVVLDKLALHGAGIGAMYGGLRVQGQEIVGKLHGHDVDLGKVAKMAGIPQHLGGLANVDVDLSSSRPGQRYGHVAIEMVNGQAAGISGVSGQVVASFAGERMRVDGLLRLVAHATPNEPAAERCDGAIASVRVSGGDGQLAGPMLDPTTWTRVSGKIEVAAEDWNLRCLARLAPVDLVLSDIRGKLSTVAVIERRPGAKLPSVKNFVARTRGLAVAGLIDSNTEKPAWSSLSTDVELRGSFDPVSGVTGAKVTLTDGSPIASVGARATLDVASFLDHPERRWDLLRVAPIEVSLNIPRRAIGAFGTLPSFVRERLPPLAGEIELSGKVTGSIEHPHAEIRAGGWGVAHVGAPPPEPVDDKRKPLKTVDPSKLAPPESPWGVPVDIAVLLGYDGEKATASAHLKHDDRAVADADANFVVPIADVLAGRPIKPKGAVEAKVTSLPLGEIPFFSDRGISGALDGTVSITGLGEAPVVKVALALPGLKVGNDLSYDEAAVQLDIGRPKGRNLTADRGAATARFELSSKTGGKLSASAFSDIVWQNALIPTVDPARPADLVAKATRFRLAVLGPFLAGVLSRVDGTLDGDARLGWTRLDDDDKARIAVRMKVADGIFHLPQLGQDLRNAQIELNGGAGGVLMLDRLSADGTKGRITGTGKAQFAGLRFVRAEASFQIKQGQELPITLEGVPLGDARGKFDIVAEKKARDLSVTIGVPRLHIDLPKSSGNSVQALDDNADVEIVQDRGKPREERGAPSRLSLTLNLGEITVKSSLLDVGLAGVKSAPIKVEMVDKAQVSGDIQLTRGRIEVMKKQFEIEQGVVHMRPEDPANPYVNVTARWDSPDGQIFIEYTGVLFPIAPEKIKYRSPTIPENRIMATLLFGGVEQSTLGAGGDKAGGVPGTGLAAQLIAQQFSTQIAGNISTSIGANDDGTFRPGLVYNAGDKVIELSTYGASNQPTTAGSAQLKGQRTLITVDWRFWRNWMLRGRVDAGSDQTVTGVDVLWQYRY
ncbi:Hypothetical protein A7982_13553 [Minicystis rosea]|nr:Hypothetical protein A7982_13553 [Minicystis rosea]